jgi:transposase
VTIDWLVRFVDGLELWTAALGLGEPWRVCAAEFGAESGRLDLQVAYPRDTWFPCPEPGCGEDRCPVHDTADKTWRHLDFFQHKAFLHAQVPRVRCPEHGVRLVAVPWARWV